MLRSLGRRVSRVDARDIGGGVGSLSEREHEVATLVAAGHTNREIAGRLFISPKTVEAHISKIFAKLGVKSRVAVTSVIERDRFSRNSSHRELNSL
jgi:DNA-binding NarL/FixJ family response regulator